MITTRTRATIACWALVLPLTLPLLACSSSDAADSGDGAGAGASDASIPLPPRLDGGAATADAGAPPPPETEEQVEIEAPRAGARFVFAANPRRDTVAVIDSSSLAIRTALVGDKPAFLTTVPGQDVALVINAGSQDASIIRTTPAALDVSTVPVSAGANTLSLAPDGRHAIAWYDSRRDGGLAGVSGSFQDITLIKLAPAGDVAIPLTVGFRPRDVRFAGDGQSAFVITEDGISVIAFAQVTGPVLLPLLAAGAAGAADTADVSITPDGRYALSRKEGSAEVALVNLTSGAVTTVTFESAVTDLDLTPDGRAALAVLRDARKMITLPLPQGFADPTVRVEQSLGGEALGSAVIAPDANTVFLYTTVGNVKRAAVGTVDGASPLRPVLLRKSVRAVAITPNSQVALVLHAKAARDANAAGTTEDQRIERAFGYSVVSIATGFAKLQLTEADPGPLSVVPDSTRAFLLLRDDARDLRLAQRINLQDFRVDDFVLGSPPLSIGVLPASERVFVSQLHPAGRLSFINWKTSEVASVTGFELNGGIRQ